MSAGNFAAWSLNASEFPATGTTLEKARYAVRYAILAPSNHTSALAFRDQQGRALGLCRSHTKLAEH